MMVSAAVNGSHQATVSMDKQSKPENNYVSEVTYYQINEQYHQYTRPNRNSVS